MILFQVLNQNVVKIDGAHLLNQRQVFVIYNRCFVARSQKLENLGTFCIFSGISCNQDLSFLFQV